ncbi:4773_t:CDS:2 [Diversispora eburnea]|uniref:4773_t:CDS:1 n=1 Tax=Diversispora eburnea TaxID=1213867 RepID=A0A9N9G2G6_9GLOM|nr:4773_t:CDS:2 [Diversispora eburnea]
MGFLGLRKWPVPIVRPMAPFIASASIVLYAIYKIETIAQSQPPFDTDPRNPRAYMNQKLKSHEGH